MKRITLVFLIVLLIPLTAAASKKEEEAQIISGFSDRAQCIAGVRVRKIDGREAAVQPMGFFIEPGTYTMTGSAITDGSTCMTRTEQGKRYRIDPIEVTVEAGKTYYLGYDHNSSNRDDWKLVIWKEEDTK